MKYILLDQKADVGTLFFRVVKRQPQMNMRVSTGIKVEVSAWVKSQKTQRDWDKYCHTAKGKAVSEKLSAIDEMVANALADGRIKSNADKGIIEDIVNSVVNADAIKIEEKRKGCVIEFYNDFMDGIQSGAIRHGDSKKYTDGSIKIWKDFDKVLNAYCSPMKTFDDVDKRFADGFTAYLENLGLMPTTIGKYIICARKLCNASAEYGINHNATSLKVWKERSVCNDDMRVEIYLTDEEIDAIYNYPLTGKEEMVRDLFVMGVISCQRFSDFSAFNEDNFEMLEDGLCILKVRQQKTGKYVEVPILDRRMLEICRKYKYVFPVVDRRRVNEHLKSIAKKVASVCPSLNDEYVTALTCPELRKEQRLIDLQKQCKLTPDQKKDLKALQTYAKEHDGQPLYKRNKRGEVVKCKWELITTHTARRSGITNLANQNVLSNRELMSISGHSSEKIFEHYIKTGVREQAQGIALKLQALKKSNNKQIG